MTDQKIPILFDHDPGKSIGRFRRENNALVGEIPGGVLISGDWLVENFGAGMQLLDYEPDGELVRVFRVKITVAG